MIVNKIITIYIINNYKREKEGGLRTAFFHAYLKEVLP